jgi:pilus assembly protein CpaF
MSVFKDAIANLLSPISNLLADPSVSEVMINGAHDIFVERKGIVSRVPNKFTDDESLMASMRAIAQSVGRVIDADNPRLDARLPDGSRIAVVIPPMARCGVTVAIRKFSEEKLTLKDLINFGSLSPEGARFLDCCMYLGRNTLVSGGTGSGKTTMLNVLGGRMPKHQRLLVIEDAAELQIKADHVVSFETRKENKEMGIKGITIRDLMESALRLRPDRIIVGEVRGPEALDLLNAMGTGHDGSMGTVHANSPADACTRLETLCLMGETRIPPDAIRRMVGSALQLIVQCSRYHDGGRRTSHISEVLGVDEHGRYIVKDIFRWIQTGKDETGKFTGQMTPTGYVPTFFEEFVANKLPFPKSTFKPADWALPFLQVNSKKAA